MQATGITLSRNQFDHVTRGDRRRAGSTGRVDVRLLDYLDLPEDELYDKIASVGMFEHVGVARFPQYFGKIWRVLEARRVRAEPRHHAQRRWTRDSLGSGIGDFVDEYVFPGGELTHVARVVEDMARAGLEVVDAEALREHYARTLWHWTERLEANATPRGAKSARRTSASGASTSRARRTRSTAAGCRCGSSSPASRCPTAGCRIR